MTRNGTWLICTVWPSAAERCPNNVRATVGPSTATRAASRVWASSKNDPAVRLRLLVVAQLSVVPMMLAVRSCALLVAISVPVVAAPGVGEPVTAGAILATSGAFCSAAASASVNGCAGGALGTLTACEMMVMLLATDSIRASTEFFTPRPQAASSTTAETPMIRPSMVSADRSQWARTARSATSNAYHRLIADLPPRHCPARQGHCYHA